MRMLLNTLQIMNILICTMKNCLVKKLETVNTVKSCSDKIKTDQQFIVGNIGDIIKLD